MSTHRIKFAKRGSLIFVSHLDFAHSFTRALKRAELPVKYSEGFSPHPKQVFALPLSVGMVGENELCDITLTEEFSHEEVKERLENAFTHEIEIKEVYSPELKMGKVKSAKYELIFEGLSVGVQELKEALSNLAPVMKTTKSGKEKELDIKSMVYGYDVKDDNGKTTLFLTLAASGDSYLNPDLVLVSMRNSGLDIPDEYDITRTDILFETK
ncbi:MAG: DUF2344 domain-containing protein [Ruminococcaceae bacterium]|nr:DUF2344 domain-containing protein [Oscillospiraceae bacterium]